MITGEQLRRLFLATPNIGVWADAINIICPGYGINTPLRLAAFLAQTGHESAYFTALSENLNYRASALTATWPKRFPADIAAQYARQPEKIANRAYANRMGNGPEESGDGWRYRGRGLIQLTGRANYDTFAKLTGRTLDGTIIYLTTPAGALESACWYWRLHDLSALADSGDIVSITKRINGGTNGLEDRQRLYAKALTILQA